VYLYDEKVKGLKEKEKRREKRKKQKAKCLRSGGDVSGRRGKKPSEAKSQKGKVVMKKEEKKYSTAKKEKRKNREERA